MGVIEGEERTQREEETLPTLVPFPLLGDISGKGGPGGGQAVSLQKASQATCSGEGVGPWQPQGASHPLHTSVIPSEVSL